MLTAERVRELFHYDAVTGQLIWLCGSATQSRVCAGDIAGTIDNKGYRVITIASARYKAHRIAWLWMTGEWPRAQIDHINLDKSDNRWLNLRAATNSQNQANTFPRVTNTSGFKGIHWHKRTKKWNARITLHYQRISLGVFNDLESARAAYKTAADEIFNEFARTE